MNTLQQQIAVAQGKAQADLVLKNASYVNLFTKTIDHGDIAICHGDIVGIGSYTAEHQVDLTEKFLLPGLIDSHIHLESSLVLPEEFAKAVVSHGTTAVITDPHEIANVLGLKGLDFMLQASENLPIDVNFVLPSCVPATPLDESGAELSAQDLAPYYKHPRVVGLAEVMNYVGVIQGDLSVLDKIQQAQEQGYIVDGHAPFLQGSPLQGYLTAGIGSDHECATLAEAEEKLRFGQMIMIREGTAAHNLETLAPLVTEKTVARCLFCTDDKHPNHLLEEGHLDMMLKKAVSLGVDPIHAVQLVTLNPAQYFNLKKQGAIAPHYQADLVVVDDLVNFHVESVYKQGKLVFQEEVLPFPSPNINPRLFQLAAETIHLAEVYPHDFSTNKPLGVMGLIAGEILTTNQGTAEQSDLSQDILHISVLERHKNTGHIGLGYLKGYGLQRGAVATSIAHDSHNVIVVGCSPEEMALAVNVLRKQQGGIVVVEGDQIKALLPLAIAGIMSKEPLETVNQSLEQAKKVAHSLGVPQDIDPFMSLSFLSLPVIPSLRITTKGVFDVSTQEYI